MIDLTPAYADKHLFRFLELKNKQIGDNEAITQFESAP